MDPITRLMGKTSLVYLLGGFVLGAVLIIGEGAGAGWVYAWTATHAHILFVGWFVQFALGIAYWLLPRRKTPEMPYGYYEPLVYVAYGLINTGLILRIIVEPMYHLNKIDGTPAMIILSISGVLQVGAAVIWVSQLRKRFFRHYSATNKPVKKDKPVN